MYELELSLDTEERQAGLRFEYPSVRPGPAGPLIDGRVHLTSGSLRLQYGFLCFGYDLDEFARQLGRLHAALDGEARFSNQEGDVAVALGVASRGRGRLAVRIDLSPYGGDPIRLGGWVVEQSYIPGMVADAHRFLTVNGIECEHPMLQSRRRT